MRYQCKTGPRSMQDRSKVNARPVQCQCKTGPRSRQDRSKVSARPVQGQCKTGPRSVQDRSKVSARPVQVHSLDSKVNAVFAGKVVRKDLVRKVKVGANVPVFVLEYLLGKYCATDDPASSQ